MTRNSGGMSSGCLASLIGIVFFGGNLFLFSGALSDDLEGNAVAYLFVIAAVMADIAIIYWVIKSIIEHVEKKHLQKQLAKAEATRAQIDKIVNYYRFSNAGLMNYTPLTSQLKIYHPHHAIMRLVDQFRSSTKSVYTALSDQHEINTALLSCSNCSTDEQRLSLLQEEIPTLEAQKEQISVLLEEYYKYRIVLPSGDESSIINLKKALIMIRNSKKFSCEGSLVYADSEESAELPAVLSCFEYCTSPLVFTCTQYCFCLFPDAILVFKDGVFLSASYPNEISITATPIELSVFVSNGDYNSDLVDVDSKCSQAGTQSKTWQYTRKDGLPDMRYSYNPVIEYHIDRMLCGKVKIEIAAFSVVYNFSSYAAYEAIEKASSQYCMLTEKHPVVQEGAAPQHTILHDICDHRPTKIEDGLRIQNEADISDDRTEIGSVDNMVCKPQSHSSDYALQDEECQNENSIAFTTYTLKHDERLSSISFKPQVINYPYLPQKKAEVREPYKTFQQMRRLEAPQDIEYPTLGGNVTFFSTNEADLFITQANFMATFVDNYEGHADFQYYFPTYSKMNDEQLRTYFTWRTRVRNGKVYSIEISYAFIYIYELINLIGVISANEGLVQLLDFWKKYRSIDKKIDHYLERWVKDFFIYYQLEYPFQSIAAQFPDSIPIVSTAQEEISHHNYENKNEFLNQLSSYKYLKSKFYDSEFGYTLIECIPLVLASVDTYLGECGISFPTFLIGNSITDSFWSPFREAIVSIRNPANNITVKTSELEEYSFSNGRWSVKKLQNVSCSNLLGYIIKTAEAELRELTNYKWKLQPNISIILYDQILIKGALSVIYHPDFTAHIRNTVNTYFLESGLDQHMLSVINLTAHTSSKPAEVAVDLNKLEGIRGASIEIQDRLTFDDPEENLIHYSVKMSEEIDCFNTASERSRICSRADEAKKAILSETHRTCISIIISGQDVYPQMLKLSKANGIMPEVMIDEINDFFFELCGDNVIDFSGATPIIHDEYISEVKKIIEED